MNNPQRDKARALAEMGQRIKKLREGLGMSQQELATRTGYKSRSSINKIELGKNDLPQSKIKEIAAVLNSTHQYLMDGDRPADGETLGDRAAPSLPEEALQVARDYTALDVWGRMAVRDLIGTEKKRCEDESRFLAETTLPPDPVVINLYGVFCVDGGTVIKQYYHDPLGMTYLFSLNRKRSDADVLIYPSSGQQVVCQGRVIIPRRYPLPSMR